MSRAFNFSAGPAVLPEPDDYSVLFLQGGATTLSALLPLNLAGPDQTADYVLSGHWGEKALENAKPSIRTHVDRALGGMRASIYNAMPVAGAQTLVDFMTDFARRKG